MITSVRSYALLGTAALCMTLAACQRDQAAAPAASDAALPAAVASGASTASATSATTLKGVYTFGPEVETFAPCNSDKTYWLVTDGDLLDPLQDLAMQKGDASNDAYPSIYLEGDFVPGQPATDGFAVDYDGVYNLSAVRQSSKDIPSTCKLLEPAATPKKHASEQADGTKSAASAPKAHTQKTPTAKK